MKTKEEIAESLKGNLPVKAQEELRVAEFKPEPMDAEMTSDVEEDYAFARDNIRDMITTSVESIKALQDLAMDAEHPRAFEVLGAMLKQTVEMNKELMGLGKDRKEFHKGKGSASEGGSTTNNAIFVGSTAELQEFLAKQKTINV